MYPLFWGGLNRGALGGGTDLNCPFWVSDDFTEADWAGSGGITKCKGDAGGGVRDSDGVA